MANYGNGNFNNNYNRGYNNNQQQGGYQQQGQNQGNKRQENSGAIWVSQSKNGNEYFSIMMGDKRYVAFKNNFKKPGSNQPDYNIYESEPRQQRPSYGQNNNYRAQAQNQYVTQNQKPVGQPQYNNQYQKPNNVAQGGYQQAVPSYQQPAPMQQQYQQNDELAKEAYYEGLKTKVNANANTAPAYQQQAPMQQQPQPQPQVQPVFDREFGDIPSNNNVNDGNQDQKIQKLDDFVF